VLRGVAELALALKKQMSPALAARMLGDCRESVLQIYIRSFVQVGHATKNTRSIPLNQAFSIPDLTAARSPLKVE
jgi:hypothetical protein